MHWKNLNGLKKKLFKILPFRVLVAIFKIGYHKFMKKILCVILTLLCSYTVVFADESLVHPIDIQESACKVNAKTIDETVLCSLKAANSWSIEVDKYFSLLHKKFDGETKQAIYESQKYWNMHKNNDFSILNALIDEKNITKEKLIFCAEQKRDIVKQRANSLKLYYVQTFPDDEQEKIINDYKSPNIFQHAVHLLRI